MAGKHRGAFASRNMAEPTNRIRQKQTSRARYDHTPPSRHLYQIPTVPSETFTPIPYTRVIGMDSRRSRIAELRQQGICVSWLAGRCWAHRCRWTHPNDTVENVMWNNLQPTLSSSSSRDGHGPTATHAPPDALAGIFMNPGRMALLFGTQEQSMGSGTPGKFLCLIRFRGRQLCSLSILQDSHRCLYHKDRRATAA